MSDKMMLEQKGKIKLDNVSRSLGKVTLQQRDSGNRNSLCQVAHVIKVNKILGPVLHQE